VKFGAGQPAEVSDTARDDVGVLVVRDHGIGMEPNERERILERFERLERTRHYGGFGVGLWIVREIVGALGGKIGVESSPGAGAEFRVELPRGGPSELS
jgi:signal transduction histidine kinase